MIHELVTANRSCRGFNPARKITEAELLELADCARLCPSSVNLQPLKYYLAWEAEETARILALTKWAAALPELHLPRPGTEPAAFIIVLQDQEISAAPTTFLKDVGIVSQTILLAAAEKGLAGCMIGNFRPAELQAALHLPETLLPQLVLALGEPAETAVLEEIAPGDSTAYWRDAQDVHHVPKRRLEDVVVTGQ